MEPGSAEPFIKGIFRPSAEADPVTEGPVRGGREAAAPPRAVEVGHPVW